MTTSEQAARDAVMDAICGYGEAMFLKGNPHNKPDQRLDQKAVWVALDALTAAIEQRVRREALADQPCWAVAWEARGPYNTWATVLGGSNQYPCRFDDVPAFPPCPPCKARKEKADAESG